MLQTSQDMNSSTSSEHGGATALDNHSCADEIILITRGVCTNTFCQYFNML